MSRTEADQIDALRRHNATLREWLDRAKADSERFRVAVYEVLGNGSDEAAWPPGKLDTDALRDYVKSLRDDRDQAIHAAHANTRELCRAWEQRDAALAEVARLSEALDAAARVVRRKADREAGKEEA